MSVCDDPLARLRQLREELDPVPILLRERTDCIRSARERGYSQERIALAAGKSRGWVRYVLENGDRRVKTP